MPLHLIVYRDADVPVGEFSDTLTATVGPKQPSVVHGVHDKIFPVETARQACQLFERIGYKVTNRELPDWGHAYPYKINEQIVLPWFVGLGSES